VVLAGSTVTTDTIPPVTAVRIEGSWPGPVTIRRGWARAESRPWNDAVPMAHLRLVRGHGSGFITDCVNALGEVGATAVLSPPLPRSAQQAWREADFQPYASLALMRRSLDPVPPPGHIIAEGTHDQLADALEIDAAAFDGFWRFDAHALEEAIAATPRSVLHLVMADESRIAGYAVTGIGNTLAYLQRVAVDPQFQGHGIGRSLVRASARWARKEGGTAIMLNTQVENEPAIRLYESEGYDTLDEPLEVLISS
jgi:ribosomal protein S18 acetylase RimI-like enzyme